jgi:hypothetical protein
MRFNSEEYKEEEGFINKNDKMHNSYVTDGEIPDPEVAGEHLDELTLKDIIAPKKEPELVTEDEEENIPHETERSRMTEEEIKSEIAQKYGLTDEPKMESEFDVTSHPAGISSSIKPKNKYSGTKNSEMSGAHMVRAKGKDNMKTMTDPKKSKTFRERLRHIFHVAEKYKAPEEQIDDHIDMVRETIDEKNERNLKRLHRLAGELHGDTSSH